MRLIPGAVHSAIGWRLRYYRTYVWHGFLRRCALYPSVFSSWQDTLRYSRALLELQRKPEPLTIRVRELEGRPLLCRPGTSDPWVLWDTFYEKYHLPLSPLPPGSCIVDLGANVGYTAAHLAALNNGSRVIAVEMDGANASLARRNLAVFGSRCELLHAAIWSKDGSVNYVGEEDQGFRISTGSREADSIRRLCPAITINSLFRRYGITRVDFLKMDIEGAEAEIFKGCLDWAQQVKSMKIEIHPPATINECSRILSDIGFRCQQVMIGPPCLFAFR